MQIPFAALQSWPVVDGDIGDRKQPSAKSKAQDPAEPTGVLKEHREKLQK